MIEPKQNKKIDMKYNNVITIGHISTFSIKILTFAKQSVYQSMTKDNLSDNDEKITNYYLSLAEIVPVTATSIYLSSLP